MPRFNDHVSSPTEAESSRNLERWSRLIADGHVPIPQDWPEADLLNLVLRVSELRRHRLLTFIARTIAQDIVRCREA